MITLNYNEELRLCRFDENEYHLVIATIREDGSVRSVKNTGIKSDGATPRDAQLAAEDILMAFTKPSIASKWA